ncbi:unnamed protein product, partial [marine sediment metagenome]
MVYEVALGAVMYGSRQGQIRSFYVDGNRVRVIVSTSFERRFDIALEGDRRDYILDPHMIDGANDAHKIANCGAGAAFLKIP